MLSRSIILDALHRLGHKDLSYEWAQNSGCLSAVVIPNDSQRISIVYRVQGGRQDLKISHVYFDRFGKAETRSVVAEQYPDGGLTLRKEHERCSVQQSVAVTYPKPRDGHYPEHLLVRLEPSLPAFSTSVSRSPTAHFLDPAPESLSLRGERIVGGLSFFLCNREEQILPGAINIYFPRISRQMMAGDEALLYAALTAADGIFAGPFSKVMPTWGLRIFMPEEPHAGNNLDWWRNDCILVSPSPGLSLPVEVEKVSFSGQAGLEILFKTGGVVDDENALIGFLNRIITIVQDRYGLGAVGFSPFSKGKDSQSSGDWVLNRTAHGILLEGNTGVALEAHYPQEKIWQKVVNNLRLAQSFSLKALN